jgi:hypothetical protein
MSRIAQTTIASPTRCRHLALATLATVLLALTGAGRPALASDLRSPDARDAATGAEAALPAHAGTDLRSPDARDAATGARAALPAHAGTDLRSPDARDAGTAAGPRVSPDLRSPDTRQLGRPQRRVSSPPASPSDSGFRWIYLAVGGLGLTLLVGGATTRHIRRRDKHAPAVVAG